MVVAVDADLLEDPLIAQLDEVLSARRCPGCGELRLGSCEALSELRHLACLCRLRPVC